MMEIKNKPGSITLYQRYKKLPPGKKVIIIVFFIWLAQALPKWTAAILADGETSAKIMRVFFTPIEQQKRQ